MYESPLRRPLRLLAFALILALVGSGLSFAGDDDERDGFNFGEKNKTKGKERTKAPGTSAPGGAEPALSPIDQEIARLARWPAREAQLAADALFLRGTEAIPYLVLALKTGDPSVQPGAATVLGMIGQEEHVHTILSAAAQRDNGSRADDFFQAAWNLSSKSTKKWLIGFLTISDRPIFRSMAANFLSERVGPDDRDRIVGLLESNKPSVRVAGLQLLVPAGVADADERLLQALSDYSPMVARKASLLIALRIEGDLAVRVNRLAREGDARERAYATLALAEAMRARGVNLFEPATLAEISGRRGLLHPDKLSRASAAVGLAYGALDTTDGGLSAMLDSTVVDILVDAVGGDHYRDYGSFMEPVFASLKRLSGRVDIVETAVAWARWWQGAKGSFRARRPLREITPTDLPRAFVKFEAVESDGRRTWAEFVSVDGVRREGGFLLTADAFAALVTALDDAGIFDSEDRREPRADEHISVALGLGDQQKRMVLTPSEGVPFMRLKMRFTSLIDANIWQRYRDADKAADARVWWETNAEMMAEASPDERSAMLASHIVYAFDDISSEEARQEALFRLVDVDTELGQTQLRVLTATLTASPSFGTIESQGLHWIIERAGDEVREALIDGVADRTESEARRILADLLVDGGVERVREGFADPRPGMRAAAARAARALVTGPDAMAMSVDELGTLAGRLRPGLEVLAVDDDETVAVHALLGLAFLGDNDIVPKLERLYKGGNLAARLSVTEALGRLPGEDGHAMLTFILSEERAQGSGQLRAAALSSLAASNHPSAVRLLSFYLLNDPDPSVRDAAGDVLAEMGSADARFAVVDTLVRTDLSAEQRARLVEVLGRFEGEVVRTMLLRYLSDKEPDVVAAAALAAADHNLDRAVPALVNILRRGSANQRPRAQRALENVTSRRFEVDGYTLVAERFEQWYDGNSHGNFRSWLRDALKDRGYDTGPLAAYSRGETDLSAVPLLVRVMRDPDPILRRNAAEALEQITGQSFGSVRRSTSVRDATSIADLWSRWWEAEGKSAAAAGGR